MIVLTTFLDFYSSENCPMNKLEDPKCGVEQSSDWVRDGETVGENLGDLSHVLIPQTNCLHRSVLRFIDPQHILHV